jgi:pterin-4a-carbinolamine dehydratase
MQTQITEDNDPETIWSRANGNDARGGRMPALGQDFLRDALSRLTGWSTDTREIRRTFEIDECQHADLTERAKVVADALCLRAEIRRVDGRTQVRICDPGNGLTAREVALAARIEDAYRTVTRNR